MTEELSKVYEPRKLEAQADGIWDTTIDPELWQGVE